MAWLTGYQYRQSPVIAYSIDAALTAYQMPLGVRESSGSGSHAVFSNVCLNGHSLDSGKGLADLRFTNLAGTNLPYWIESVSGTTPNQLWVVWINIDSIPQSNTTIYMYYGNAGAIAASSGATTFGVNKFDDFEWGINGTHLHDYTGNVAWVDGIDTPNISTAITPYSGTRSAYFNYQSFSVCPITVTAGMSVSVRFYKVAGSDTVAYLECGIGSYLSYSYLYTNTICYYDTKENSTGVTVSDATWYLVEHKNFNTTNHTYDLYVNGSLAVSGCAMSNGSLSSVAIGAYSSGTGKASYCDNFIIRNWTAHEPTWGDLTKPEEMFYLNPQLIYPHILVR